MKALISLSILVVIVPVLIAASWDWTSDGRVQRDDAEQAREDLLKLAVDGEIACMYKLHDLPYSDTTIRGRGIPDSAKRRMREILQRVEVATGREFAKVPDPVLETDSRIAGETRTGHGSCERLIYYFSKEGGLRCEFSLSVLLSESMYMVQVRFLGVRKVLDF